MEVFHARPYIFVDAQKKKSFILLVIPRKMEYVEAGRRKIG